MHRTSLHNWILCALFAALTAVLTQIAIPFVPVPINMATFSVYLSGALLGKRWGATSQLIYLLMGAAGMPVFSSFRSGLGMLVGPTGGYIVGYVAVAWIVGYGVERWGLSTAVRAMGVGTAVLYTLGTLWFLFVMENTTIVGAFMACVFPFLLGDALKIAAVSTLAPRLRRALPQ